MIDETNEKATLKISDGRTHDLKVKTENNKINSYERGSNPIVVTTQCIEAGVDIDVDYIIRDWAPLDSIFQVCGRCNRNGEKEIGAINIINLKSDRGRSFSEMVYDEVLLECTTFSITGNRSISENQFYDFGTRYFKSVRDNLGQSMKVVRAYSGYPLYWRYSMNGWVIFSSTQEHKKRCHGRS